MSLRTTIAFTLSFAVVKWSVFAQGPIDKSAPGYDWTFNSLGQSPCIVENVLMDACDGECVCSPVIYSLASACSATESLPWSTWGRWFVEHNCTSLDVDRGPLAIPLITRVPHWAYAPVGATWNSTAAEGYGDTAESTGVPSHSSTTSLPLSTSASSGVTASTSQGHGLSRGAKAAIAAGVVGGVAALVLVLFLLNRRRTRAASARFRERVGSRYFDMKVGPRGLENVQMHKGPFDKGTETLRADGQTV
ncbi:hypothetical protein FA95DRAFT_1561129 [Auriscalpium vulgare]|uniref:Uncharacterized protein n=1 Tax=Auriscalpium vulgare TaxID=40419 RepID=A0ACB8RNM9_9AGAM|nr:hypothetical protein FA95DRAFT_1561129 [Auriscalpium vulgare]